MPRKHKRPNSGPRLIIATPEEVERLADILQVEVPADLLPNHGRPNLFSHEVRQTSNRAWQRKIYAVGHTDEFDPAKDDFILQRRADRIARKSKDDRTPNEARILRQWRKRQKEAVNGTTARYSQPAKSKRQPISDDDLEPISA